MPNTYSFVLRRLKERVEKCKPLRLELDFIPWWTATRTFLEFIIWCIGDEECSDALRKFVRSYREQFILKAILNPTYIKSVVHAKI